MGRRRSRRVGCRHGCVVWRELIGASRAVAATHVVSRLDWASEIEHRGVERLGLLLHVFAASLACGPKRRAKRLKSAAAPPCQASCFSLSWLTVPAKARYEDADFVLFAQAPRALAGLHEQDDARFCCYQLSDPAPSLDPGVPGMLRIRQWPRRDRRRALADQSAARRDRAIAPGHRQLRQRVRTASGSRATLGP